MIMGSTGHITYCTTKKLLEREVEQLPGSIAKTPAWGWYFMGTVEPPPGHRIYLESKVSYSAASPLGRLHGSRSQGVEAEVTTLTLTPHDPFGKCGPPVHKALAFAGLEILVFNGRTLPPRDTGISRQEEKSTSLLRSLTPVIKKRQSYSYTIGAKRNMLSDSFGHHFDTPLFSYSFGHHFHTPLFSYN